MEKRLFYRDRNYFQTSIIAPQLFKKVIKKMYFFKSILTRHFHYVHSLHLSNDNEQLVD